MRFLALLKMNKSAVFVILERSEGSKLAVLRFLTSALLIKVARKQILKTAKNKQQFCMKSAVNKQQFWVEMVQCVDI